MAVTTPRRAPKDPEGRMPLREHLAELRTRLVRAGIAIVLGSIVGWYLYDWVFDTLQEPLNEVGDANDITAAINFNGIADAFNLKVRLSVYLGLLVASPVWLYQLWAFVVPGLTKKEKRYSLGFVAAAVPLLVGGVYLAWLTLPNAVGFFGEFIPEGSVLFPSAEAYFTFATRLMITFGVAMVVPLLLVALNMAGLISHHAMAKGWRVAVFLIFVFAAIASPTPDAASMIILAMPMVVLYMVAVGVAWWVDRRRAKRAVAEGWGDLDDDEASTI